MCELRAPMLGHDCLDNQSLISTDAAGNVHSCRQSHTRAMCYHSLCQLFFGQSRQRMESTPYLECANALVILAFEKEVDLRPCGCLAIERSANQGSWRLGCRCKL